MDKSDDKDEPVLELVVGFVNFNYWLIPTSFPLSSFSNLGFAVYLQIIKCVGLFEETESNTTKSHM